MSKSLFQIETPNRKKLYNNKFGYKNMLSKIITISQIQVN